MSDKYSNSEIIKFFYYLIESEDDLLIFSSINENSVFELIDAVGEPELGSFGERILYKQNSYFYSRKKYIRKIF